VESFGNKMILSDILDVDPKGGALATRKVPFIVTDPRLSTLTAFRIWKRKPPKT
jgi:hypothetical protein